MHTLLDDRGTGELRRALAGLDGSPAALRGVVHAAGQWGVQSFVELTGDALSAALSADAASAWDLHRLTRDRELDFFVLFSSVAAVWGSSGMAPCAAAHQALDALAHHRRSLGLPALSVDWVQWADAGVMPEEAYRVSDRTGVKAIPYEQASWALEALLDDGVIQAVVAPVDWDIFKPLYESRGPRPFLSCIVIDDPARGDEAARESEIGRRYREALPDERKEILIQYIQDQVAAVLGFSDADAIEPERGFFELGMDSISSVTLKRRLEKDLRAPLPSTLTFEHPTPLALAGYLADHVLSPQEPSAREPSTQAPLDEPPAPLSPPASDLSSALDELSEDELARLLSDELASLADEREDLPAATPS